MRQELSGIYFLWENNILTVAATDSFRLAEQKFLLGASEKTLLSLIKPLKRF